MAVVAVECVDEAEAPMPRVSAYPPEKSHAELVVGSGMWEVRAGCEGRGPSRGLACEGSEVGWARLRCPWWCSESAPEKSHAIRLGEVSTKSENVAIPTI